MKQSTRDEAEGTFHDLKGSIKSKVGKVTNDPNLEVEGVVEKIGGKLQKKIGQVERLVEKP